MRRRCRKETRGAGGEWVERLAAVSWLRELRDEPRRAAGSIGKGVGGGTENRMLARDGRLFLLQVRKWAGGTVGGRGGTRRKVIAVGMRMLGGDGGWGEGRGLQTGRERGEGGLGVGDEGGESGGYSGKGGTGWGA